ncbi:15263_t:CDS:2 [Entrophospora sp. SA101]|nr:15263_t:CDS:2 [Entrophospora sp. SA101]
MREVPEKNNNDPNTTTSTATNNNPSNNKTLKRSPIKIIGVKEPPNLVLEETKTQKKTLLEGLKYRFTKEGNLEKRNELIKEYKTSFFKDFHQLRTEGIKLWEASTEINKSEDALYMPNIKTRSLSTSQVNTTELLKGHISMVVMYFNRFGQDQSKSFIKPFLETFSNNSKIQYIEDR